MKIPLGFFSFYLLYYCYLITIPLFATVYFISFPVIFWPVQQKCIFSAPKQKFAPSSTGWSNLCLMSTQKLFSTRTANLFRTSQHQLIYEWIRVNVPTEIVAINPKSGQNAKFGGPTILADTPQQQKEEKSKKDNSPLLSFYYGYLTDLNDGKMDTQAPFHKSIHPSAIKTMRFKKYPLLKLFLTTRQAKERL